MPSVGSPVKDVPSTAKSREIQRGMLAEMRGDKAAVEKHMLAAAQMELVLADDFRNAGKAKMAYRSLLSAASAFWRAGYPERARPVFAAMSQEFPEKAAVTNEAIQELEQMAAKRDTTVS
jgi:hypothetical protein